MMDSCSLSAFPIALPGADGKQKMNANAAGVLVVEDVSHIPLDALQLLKAVSRDAEKLVAGTAPGRDPVSSASFPPRFRWSDSR